MTPSSSEAELWCVTVSSVQKKREEIKKLIASQRGKSQQIENLENEHKVQRRKLEGRIEHQSEKICALEAQLSNRITLHQQVHL